MKKIFKLTLAVALVVMSVATASAQKNEATENTNDVAVIVPMFGRVDINAIIPNMPEFKEASDSLDLYRQDLINQLEIMQVELNQKYAEYQKNVATYSDTIRQMKETELQDLSQRLGNFEQIAQQDLQQKEAELINPVTEKAFEAINEVAKAAGFLAVFNTAGDQPTSAGLVYFDADALVDITDAVKKYLGIEE